VDNVRIRKEGGESRKSKQNEILLLIGNKERGSLQRKHTHTHTHTHTYIYIYIYIYIYGPFVIKLSKKQQLQIN
jgi:hypothetical protein